MSAVEIKARIHDIERKLDDQLASIQGMRGHTEDVIRLMVPAMRDQLELMKEILELIPDQK